MEKNSVRILNSDDIVKILSVLDIHYKGPRWIQYVAKKLGMPKFPNASGYIFLDTNGRYVGAYNFIKQIYEDKTGQELTWREYEKAVIKAEEL